MSTPAIMFQGTGSNVGKSLIVAGLCRLFYRRGLSVRPFKPQNMSNNAAVTQDNGEIGRAQALQARACGVAPSVHMNPVLLKPHMDTGAQVVVCGQVMTSCSAREYTTLKPTLLPMILDSFEILAQEADLILVEGAGSPAEINLRAGDIANMGFAEAVDVPVILIGDIERGGVIASLVGTFMVLPEQERDRLKGYLINKYRGDRTLFDDGLVEITTRTAMPSLGVIPYCDIAHTLPAEDTLGLVQTQRVSSTSSPIRIAVPQLSRIANFDDLDPLRLEPDVCLMIIPAGQSLPGDCTLVILPGSKSTISDLVFLREQGWDIDLLAHYRRGGFILGLCGGFQMLGKRISDLEGLEGPAGIIDGLGLLDVETVLTHPKTIKAVCGWHVASGAPFYGYEIHLGQTTGTDLSRPFVKMTTHDHQTHPDGAMSQDRRVSGCYVHGLFASDSFRQTFLSTLMTRPDSGLRFEETVDSTLDALADHLAAHLDVARIMDIAKT